VLASEWQFGVMWKSGPFRAALRLQQERASALVVVVAGPATSTGAEAPTEARLTRR
jgi:hypothetical protein